MRHPNDGELRRLLDEAWVVPAPLRGHVQSCERCRMHIASLQADAEAAQALFGTEGTTDAAAARERFALNLGKGLAPVRSAAPPRRLPYWRIAGGAAAAIAVLAIGFTPIGSYAKGLLLIFQPQSFKAVPIAPSDGAALPNLRQLGNLQGVRNIRLSPAASLAAAQAAAGFKVLAAGQGVPANLGSPVYAVMPSQTESLQLSASKVAAYAVQHHLQIPPLPADLAGSMLSVTTGPAVVTSYGGSLSTLGASGRMPQLLIAQAPAPKVYSTGATVQEIEQYLLSIPGISPQLAAEIRSIGDPTRTLPIPIPIGRALSKTVMVNGAQGLAINDQTGIGSAVVWQKNGMVYTVVGSLPESQALTVAQGLH
ncbi:MAG: hypothetical protein M0Z66_04160 [Thermaerobacter sp.]|nr:hypothetical protein [Thermaerobacter sp.]